MRSRTIWIPVSVLALIVVAPCVTAARTVPGMERLFGATLNNAAFGDGRVSACFAESGTLCCLRFPDPTHFTVVDHTTSGDEDARDQPYFGAEPNEGSFAGLAYGQGPQRRVSWLRDEWEFVQTYDSDDSSVLVTVYINPELRMTVTDRSTVVPGRDLLIRQYRIVGAGLLDSPALVYYENLDTVATVSEGFPGEWMDSGQHDSGCLYHAAGDFIVHPGLEGEDTSFMDGAAGLEDADGFIDGLDGIQTGGFFVLVAGKQGSGSHQCGLEDAEDGPEMDALLDAQDGGLAGNAAAVGEANGALQFDVEGDEAVITVLFAFGETLQAARDSLEYGRATSDEDLFDETDRWWGDWLAGALLPGTDDPDLIAFSKRTLMSIRSGTDPVGGAIVASLSNNPPYALSWPRDGVYFDLALNVAGHVDMGLRHQEFFARVMRQQDGDQPNILFCGNGQPNSFEKVTGTCEPAGSWSMNYYADGRVGGPIGFEIDQVGITLWSLAEQIKWIETSAERLEYLEKVYPSIRKAADLLVLCKDRDNGLQCLASEDDNPSPTQGQQGAFNAAAGLYNAVFAARVYGETEDAERWQERLDELELAILGRWAELEGDLPHVGDGATAAGWAFFPAHSLFRTDVTLEQQAAYIWSEIDQPDELLNYAASDTYAGGQYDTKHAFRLALVWPEGHPSGLKVLEFLKLLAVEMPIPGTRHYGEHYLYEDYYYTGRKEFVQTVAVPHIWEATMVYLALIAYFDNETFALSDDPADYPLDDKGSGCGCVISYAGGATTEWALLVLVLIGLSFMRTRIENALRPR